MKWELKGLLRSRICPRRLITPDSFEWLHLRSHYVSGFLAIGGGVVDQPQAYLEAMALIQSWISKDGN